MFNSVIGSSPVPTFEVEAEEFKRHCTARGVTLNTIKEAFSDCKAKPANAQSLFKISFINCLFFI